MVRSLAATTVVQRQHLYRYTEWAHFNCGEFLNNPMDCKEPSTPEWSMVYGVELYNHTGDPSTAPESFGECLLCLPASMPVPAPSCIDTRHWLFFHAAS